MSGYQTQEEVKAEVNIERKGGVQLTISFSDDVKGGAKPTNAKALRRRELRAKKHQKPAEEEK
jgi:hypothetical protein